MMSGWQRVVVLTPPRYECSVDGYDLTRIVSDELAGGVVAGRTSTSVRPFRLVLSCPGDGLTHDVAVSGQVRYSR